MTCNSSCSFCEEFVRSLALIFSNYSSGFIPIVSSLAETDEGKIVNVCPTRATDELAAHFEPLKVMYLNSKGGLLNEKGRVIEGINLPHDLEVAATLPWCNRKIQTKLTNIYALLEKLPFTSSVVITSADTVLNELFTHKGKDFESLYFIFCFIFGSEVLLLISFALSYAVYCDVLLCIKISGILELGMYGTARFHK